MQLSGTIRSRETREVTAEDDSLPGVRALIEAQVPDGWELTQLESDRHKDGMLTATGHLRSLEKQEITANGGDYDTARAALLALVPDGWQLIASGRA